MAELVPRWEWRTFGETFGPGRGGLRRAHRGACRGERRAVPALRRERRVGQGPGRADGRQASGGGRRRRARAVGAGAEGRLSAARLRRRRRARRAAGRRPAASTAPPTASTSSSTRSCARTKLCWPSDVHKRRARYTLGGCMAELSEVRTDRALDAHDRGRVGGSRPGGRRRALARPLLPDERLHGPRPEDAPRLRGEAIRGDRRRHELGQAPRRRAARRRHVEHGRRPRRGDPPRARASTRRAPSEPEPMRRTMEAIAGMAEEARRAGAVEIAAVGTAWLRAAANGAELVGAVEARCGVRIEIIPGEEEARLAYLAAVSGLELGARPARRLRHRRRQLPVHVRPRRGDRRAVQRPRRRGAPDRALRARPARLR